MEHKKGETALRLQSGSGRKNKREYRDIYKNVLE